MHPYSSLCDLFGVHVYLNTKIDLPVTNETALHFLETVNKSFPELSELSRRDNGEFVLEEDTDHDAPRAVAVDPKRIISAYSNPSQLAEADKQHESILDFAPYHLDLTPINCESLEVVFSFDLMYQGNHDEVIAEALAAGSPFEGLLRDAPGRVLHFEPALAIALDDRAMLHARIWVESHTNLLQVQSDQYPEAPLSVFLCVNQLWSKDAPKTFAAAYRHQRRLAQEMADAIVVPNFLQPLYQTIAGR